MTAAELRIEGVTVRYGESVAVDDISLTLEAGQTLALVGANGAGKSSLFGAVAGIVPFASGRIEVDGKSLPRGAWRVARRRVGYVPEHRHLFADLSVDQHFEVAARRLPRTERPAAVSRALGFFPALERLGSRRAEFLSGGERSMLAVARAIVPYPRLLLLDEPSLGLSPIATSQLIESLETIQQDGLTILLAEQSLRVPRALADSLMVMRLGTSVRQGRASDILSSGELRDSLM